MSDGMIARSLETLDLHLLSKVGQAVQRSRRHREGGRRDHRPERFRFASSGTLDG